MNKKQSKMRAASFVAALALLATCVAASAPSPQTTVCGAQNVGCESGASAGKPVCSLLGNLYRKTYTAAWGCTTSNAIISYSCDVAFDDDNCCGRPNAQSCPSASCPCDQC